ncbi:DUF4232 domain-containing protein [Streptomyces griseofuscus]|uniref:DUF4232 domain-containing protein n=1 Tax=Streptomyces griseofuscus TaxID=146922 RepID=UPI001189D3F3|nr:DUF4232 domain-containing protein [Streptomyces rochei]
MSRRRPPQRIRSAPARRPANLKTKITQDAASSGHRHYRVTLAAAPRTSACQLGGSPRDVKFYDNSSLKGVTAKPYGSQGTKVTFGPGHPVHFDIQVPSTTKGAKANRVVFTLRTPASGIIPGDQESDGKLSAQGIRPRRPRRGVARTTRAAGEELAMTAVVAAVTRRSKQPHFSRQPAPGRAIPWS